MTQEMLAVCDKCKVIFRIGNFTNEKIEPRRAVEFFRIHKGHPIRIIGDDGGWDLVLEKLTEEKGYCWIKTIGELIIKQCFKPLIKNKTKVKKDFKTRKLKCPCGCGNYLFVVKSYWFDDAIVIGIGKKQENAEGFLVNKKVLEWINDMFEKLGR